LTDSGSVQPIDVQIKNIVNELKGYNIKIDGIESAITQINTVIADHDE